MRHNLKKYLLLFSFIVVVSNSSAQLKETSKWKALIALGFNSTNEDGFVEGVKAQFLNFPTVNLGIQHMFKNQYGLRLDFGFNRFKNDDNVPDFKVNYSRINAQFVFDPSDMIGFLPQLMRTILHAGPGLSFVKPLGTFGDNKQTYLNLLGGLEIHYAIKERLSIYTDISYIYGLTSLDDYNPALDGLGAFNGDILNISIGLSVSLSGCQYCD